MQTVQVKSKPQFSQPFRQIFILLVILALVAMLSAALFSTVAPVFLANIYLNGFIVAVFFVGVMACFYQLLTLTSSVQWIEAFANQRSGHKIIRPPKLLAPLAALLKSRDEGMHISASSAQSLLDSVATRIDEAREITRYLCNFLIFLGLLGTFYGLATTVPALVETIRSLNVQDGESALSVFGRLQTGLEKQLDGMGVAFASSLLGLAGSLVIGLMELFAGHGQNRFYRELEEWLSTITKFSFSDADGFQDNNALSAVMAHFAEQIDWLRVAITRLPENLGAEGYNIDVLVSEMRSLTQAMRTEHANVMKTIEGGFATLIQQADESHTRTEGADAESRMRLRSIDAQLARICDELSVRRQGEIADLHKDIDALKKIVNKPPLKQNKKSDTDS